jgi:ABC-2 type transport system ATP-binding protein
MGEPLVRVEGLYRYFGHVKAVTDVSFAFDRGTIFGFIGPNGAGKTTTMRILATLDIPTGGEAWIGEDSVIDYPDRIRGRIGFMPDYYGTYANMNVEEYLDFFGRAYSLRGRKLRESREGVIDFTGMQGIRTKAIDTLSKGMKQRLGLGRILMHDPDVLILDEPAAGLDPRARVEFRELLKVLAEQGKSILISSHILTELSGLVHACAIIERGRCVAQGTVDEVREKARAETGQATQLQIEVLENAETVEKLLLEQPFVEEIRISDRTAIVDFHGDRAAAATLLKTLIQYNIDVVSFQTVDADLEDVFMAVTRGDVQ